MPFESLAGKPVTRSAPVLRAGGGPKVTLNAAAALAVCEILGVDRKKRPDIWIEFFVDADAREIALEPHLQPTAASAKLSWGTGDASSAVLSAKKLVEAMGMNRGDTAMLSRRGKNWLVASY